MFPHNNPLPKPDILITPEFEQLLSSIKSDVLDYIQVNSPDDFDGVLETFNNEAELLTKFTEAFTVILQNHTRQLNAQAQQMFGMYATDTKMVDLIASQLGVQRQVVSEGDANAFPVVEPTMESNESLLTRYYLAAYALASTGTRSGYRFHAMTLGGRPSVDIQSSSSNEVLVTYSFDDHEQAGRTKDAQARQTSPGAVDCFILSHDNNGIADNELIAATQQYLERDDIGQETDLITVKPATIKPWTFQATIYVSTGPDVEVIKKAAIAAVQSYADTQHVLGGRIETFMLNSVLVEASGAHSGDIVQPSQPLRCDYSEAPYLDSINITVITENV